MVPHECCSTSPLPSVAIVDCCAAHRHLDADMRRMARASAACHRLMTIPGVAQLTALAFVAAIAGVSGSADARGIAAMF